jgi:hypothetical protein
MTEEDVLRRVQDKTKTFKLLKIAAYDAGVTPSYLTQVTKGHRPPYQKLLDWVGIKKTTKTIITYEEIK